MEALFNARDEHDELEYEDLLTIIEKTQVPGLPFQFFDTLLQRTTNYWLYLVSSKQLLNIVSNLFPDDMSPLTNESLINHGSFVVGQVTSYEDAGDEDEERFMVDMPCMRYLIKQTGKEIKIIHRLFLVIAMY